MEQDLNSQLVSHARAGNVDRVKELLAKGAEVNSCNAAGESAIHAALSWNQQGMIGELIKAGADINIRDKDGKTLLMRVASQGDISVAQRLLSCGASVNAVDSTYNRTALMQASLHGKTDMVTLLLEWRANVYSRDKNGLTAADLAQRWGKESVLEVFYNFYSAHAGRPANQSDARQFKAVRSQAGPSSINIHSKVITVQSTEALTTVPSTVNESAVPVHGNFQASSSQQGNAFAQMCITHLKVQGFDLRGPRYLKEAGVEIDQVAMNRCGNPIYFEFKGSTVGDRPGMIRTDTTKKAIANAFLLDRLGMKPFVVLTSHKVKVGSASDAMIKTAGNPILEVLCLMEPEDMKRLKQYLDSPVTSEAPKPVNKSDGDLAHMSKNRDISESALIMIDNRGGYFEEDDCWEEITEFLQWGSGKAHSDSEFDQQISRDRFFSTLDALCENGFLRKKDLRRIVLSWELTEKGSCYLRERGYIV